MTLIVSQTPYQKCTFRYYQFVNQTRFYWPGTIWLRRDCGGSLYINHLDNNSIERIYIINYQALINDIKTFIGSHQRRNPYQNLRYKSWQLNFIRRAGYLLTSYFYVVGSIREGGSSQITFKGE